MNAPAIPIDADALMSAACVQENLHDYGDPWFVEPLRRLLASVLAEGHLNAMGRDGLRMEIMRHLVNRLRLREDLRRHPEILAEDVADPIIITGSPRAGTTKLHRMIAHDPGMQSLPLWRALFPAPFPDASGANPDPRRSVAETMAAQLAQYFPDVFAGHSMHADEAEEELLLLQFSFAIPANAWFYRAPSFFAWIGTQSQAKVYEELRLLLRYLQWQDGGKRGRPWILKSPLHLESLALLLDVFPRASIVHCHREPDVIVPSICRLVDATRASRGHERIDRAEIGAFLAETIAAQWDENMRQRQHLSDADAQRVHDIAYGDILANTSDVIGDLYAQHGVAPSASGIATMRDWERHNPQGRHGEHRYTLADYGLDRETLNARFAAYRTRFADLL